MNSLGICDETDAVTLPMFLGSTAALYADQNAFLAFPSVQNEFDTWRLWNAWLGDGDEMWSNDASHIFGVVISCTTAATQAVTVEPILLSNLWHGEYVHRLEEGRVVNSTSGRKSWDDGSYSIDAVVPPSPEATAPVAVPEVVVAVPNPLAGYDRYAEANWDCYGAEPISTETVDAARRLLDILPNRLGTPHISPGSDGTIGLEWVFTEGPLRKLFIDVGPGRIWSGYWRRASGERRTLAPKSIDARTEAEFGALFNELST